MKSLLERQSWYWQLRFLAAGAGAALVLYAVLLPDSGNKTSSAQIQSVAAAHLAPAKESEIAPKVVAATSAAATPQATSKEFVTPWLGENPAVEEQLKLAAESYLNADLPRDFSESTGKLRSGANQGDAVAQFLLGHAFATGAGVSKDMAEAARWYALAGEARSPVDAAGVAQAAPRDFSQAFEMYKKTAEQGDSGAELYIGLAYDLGLDAPGNAAEAARWYRMAAAQGSSAAACDLGVLYYNGYGVPKDSVEAAAWFRKAAVKGSASAQFSLGRMYYEGDGVEQSYPQAAAWLERAARQGNAPAQVLLSLMYATGQGVPGSTARAYLWINLASATVEQARVSREQIAKVIPAQEMAEGQKLTHDWLRQNAQRAP